jgi:hypothetical protein
MSITEHAPRNLVAGDLVEAVEVASARSSIPRPAT